MNLIRLARLFKKHFNLWWRWTHLSAWLKPICKRNHHRRFLCSLTLCSAQPLRVLLLVCAACWLTIHTNSTHTIHECNEKQQNKLNFHKRFTRTWIDLVWVLFIQLYLFLPTYSQLQHIVHSCSHLLTVHFLILHKGTHCWFLASPSCAISLSLSLSLSLSNGPPPVNREQWARSLRPVWPNQKWDISSCLH